MLATHRLTTLSLTEKSLASTYRQRFTTSARHFNKEPSQKSHVNPGELPAFSMKDLGANKTVKTVVYLTVGIIGTAETITYTKLAYRYFYPPPTDDVDISDP
jgi:hypothetical protein